MKIIAMIQAYNELEQGNLRRCLESVSRYCDDICVYDDCSTDGSADVYDEFGAKVIWGEVNDFANELEHKQIQLDKIRDMGADWIWRIDCDEVVEKAGEDGGVRELCETAKFDSWAFHTVNLWRSPCFYRLDNSYNDVVFNRLWRIPPEGLKFQIQKGLHLTNYPIGMTDNEGFTKLELLHYGFASDEAILYKYQLYKKHGQDGWKLDRLVNERGLSVARSRQDWFDFTLPPHSANDVFKLPIASKV